MSRYIAFSIPGSMEPWEGSDYEIGILGIAGAVVRLKMTLGDGADGDDFACDLRDASGGLGSGMTFTITDGNTTAVEVTAPQLDVSATETLYLRVTEAAGAGNLAGWLEYDPTGTEEVDTFLTTLSRVKTDEGISAATYDAQLSRLIQGVSAAMQSWIGRTIVDTTYTDEVHSGTGWTDALILNHRPITSTTTMVVKKSDVAVDASLYTSHAGEGVVYLTDANWTSGRHNYKVTYSAGYTAIPEDLAMACTAQVRHEFHQSKKDAGKLGQESQADPAGGSTAYTPYDFLPMVLSIMRPYRRLV